jgi:eukaryotic-like serine/threonine-protein kinase
MCPAESLTQLHDPTMMRAASRVGRVLRDKWTLDRLLGVGGMAAVYAASHRNGKRAAIKMLHPELSADPQIRERFLREGRAANRVGHPGALSVLDDDVAEDGSIFLVMDLLEGESLENRRERAGGQLDLVDVLSITDQVLDVLAAAHAKGIVHRDLKPDNLFVTREGAVKVLDFGIARLREGTANATVTGISMGTPSYMAQEQARGLWNEVDQRTDLWAVGATIFACLTGRVVHEGRTANEQLLSAMTKSAPPIRSLVPDTPRPVAEFIDRALAFERDGRFQTSVEMQSALRAAYEAMQSAPISTAPRLVVPDIAIQRTMTSMAGFESDATVRTDGPVASGDTGALRRPTWVGQRAGLRGAAVVLGCTAILTMVLVVRELGKTPASPMIGSAAPPVVVSAAVDPAAAPLPSASSPSSLASAHPISEPSAAPSSPARGDKRKGKAVPPQAPPVAASSPPPPADLPDDPFAGGRHK